jgi:hypothetical protein
MTSTSNKGNSVAIYLFKLAFAFRWPYFASSCDFTSINGDCIFVCVTDDPVTAINTSVTAYYGLAGSLDTVVS